MFCNEKHEKKHNIEKQQNVCTKQRVCDRIESVQFCFSRSNVLLYKSQNVFSTKQCEDGEAVVKRAVSTYCADSSAMRYVHASSLWYYVILIDAIMIAMIINNQSVTR